MFWLGLETVRRSPRRLLLAAVAVAFPVATLAATLLFIDHSVGSMTTTSLAPVQVEMRALATSLSADMGRVRNDLRGVAGVRRVDAFGAADVILSAPGSSNRVTARLFAVEPPYVGHHPWVRAGGDVSRGALLNEAVATAPGFVGAGSISVDLRGDVAPLGLTLPVAGRVDVRDATTWFAIPAGDVQGDVAVVPRVVVVDYATFERAVLPALLKATGKTAAVTNPGLSELPAASLEAHIAVDHRAFPSDPSRAASWSARLRRVLERQAPGTIIVADNTAEPLAEAGADATNAKVLFLLLGIPGALVAAALGLAAASALAEAHRREDALLRLRGATDAQVVRMAVGEGLLAGAVGVALGLAVASAAVWSVVGHAPWDTIAGGRLAFTTSIALATGALTTATRLFGVRRAGRRSGLAVERRALAGPWMPGWRRHRLDLVAIGAGLVILGGNALAGGLRPAPVQGQQLALSFYVLLAPLALWLGTVLLATRVLLGVIARAGRPDQRRPLSSWGSTAVRWLGRRPARAGVALVLGALAVAFGTQVATFVATYRTAKQADVRAAFGSDLRFVTTGVEGVPLPPLGSLVPAVTPILSVPARAGSDRKTIMAVDPASYAAATTTRPLIVRGGGLDQLARDPRGVLVAQEIATLFSLAPGDTLPVTVYPDDLDLAQKLDLHVVGIYRAFAPTEPVAEMVAAAATVPSPRPAPDFYLARVAPGSDPDRVARELHRTGAANGFAVTTVNGRAQVQQRTLTALNLGGLGRIEAAAAGLIAAVGVGILGAFLVLERRRELAVLRTLGATTAQTLTGVAFEGMLAAVGSLLLGLPVGLGLGVVSVRVLGFFFALPPPVATVPIGPLVELTLLVVGASTAALGVIMWRASRVEVATILREP